MTAALTGARSLNALIPIDRELIRIFDTWGGSGDLGSLPYFALTLDEAGPITRGDIWRIALAEEYLHTSGFFGPNVESNVQVSITAT